MNDRIFKGVFTAVIPQRNRAISQMTAEAMEGKGNPAEEEWNR